MPSKRSDLKSKEEKEVEYKPASNMKKISIQHAIKSVGMKIFLSFFTGILFFVVMVGAISYFKSRNLVTNQLSQASLQAITQAGQKMDFLFGSFENLTLQIMHDQDLQAQLINLYTVKKDSIEYTDLNRKLIERLTVYKYAEKNIAAIHLFRANGDYIKIPGTSMNGDNFAEKDWFQRVKDGGGNAVWLESQQKGYSGTLTGSGFAIGRMLSINIIVMLEISTDVFVDQLKGIDLGKGSVIQLSTQNHLNVYSPKPEDIGNKASIILDKQVMEKKDDSITIDDKQIVFYKSPISKWYLISSIPLSSLSSSVKSIANVTLWISMLAMVAALFIGYFVARMIRLPINRMRDLMEQGAKGNLKVRAGFTSKDEIGQLGQSFDLMMEQITVLVEKTSESAIQVFDTALEVTNASRTAANSAREIAVATEQISTGASGLAKESEHGIELTSQIGERIKNMIQANDEMRSAALEVQNSSKQGMNYMFKLSSMTKDAETMISSMVEKVDKLKDSARSIRKILDVLNNLTKQTNILSFNATIEAARAAAAGKGFMVVADEIRKLADQSKQSIGVVTEITDMIQREIEETVKVLSDAYPIFEQQILSGKNADTIFQEVRINMASFISQLNNVSDSIIDLEGSQVILSDTISTVTAVTQQSLVSSEEVSSLGQEQLSVSEGLVKVAERLENLSTSLQASLALFKT